MRYRSHRAFTLIELLVVIAIVAILMSVLVSVAMKVRRQSANVRCASNLRQISTALLIWANEHGRKFPDPNQTGQSWEMMIAPSAGHGIFVCPSDEELAPAVGSSYDWRDTGHPNATLAGQPISAVTRSTAIIVFESLPGWHQNGKVIVARNNASIETITQDELVADLVEPITHLGGN